MGNSGNSGWLYFWGFKITADGFSSGHVWMWELDYKESWAPKNWCFELWYWRRLLSVPWTARRSNQSILKEISPEYSLEGQMLKLKLQYFGHLIRRVDSFEQTLMLWKIEGRRRRGWQRMRWLDGITDSMDMGCVDCGSWWWTGRPGMLRFMGSQRVGHDWATELNWYIYSTSSLIRLHYYLQSTEKWECSLLSIWSLHSVCLGHLDLNKRLI